MQKIKITNDKLYTITSKYNLFRDFSNDINNKYTIWKSYHKELLINKYDLKETKNIILFNTANIGYNGYSLNHLNRFLSEGCCLLYPYLNNLKSEYIGFQHYRRFFNDSIIDFNKLNNDYIQYFWKYSRNNFLDKFNHNSEYVNIENHAYIFVMLECGFGNDIIEFLETKYPQYLELEKNWHPLIALDIFNCKWDLYCELAQFILDYIDFINTKYFLDWNENNWLNHILDKYIKYVIENNINYNRTNFENDFY